MDKNGKAEPKSTIDWVKYAKNHIFNTKETEPLRELLSVEVPIVGITPCNRRLITQIANSLLDNLNVKGIRSLVYGGSPLGVRGTDLMITDLTMGWHKRIIVAFEKNDINSMKSLFQIGKILDWPLDFWGLISSLASRPPKNYLEVLKCLISGFETLVPEYLAGKYLPLDAAYRNNPVTNNMIKEMLKHPKLLNIDDVHTLLVRAREDGNSELVNIITKNKNFAKNFLDEIFESEIEHYREKIGKYYEMKQQCDKKLQYLEKNAKGLTMELAKNPLISKSAIAHALKSLVVDGKNLHYDLGFELIKNPNAPRQSVNDWCNKVKKFGTKKEKEEVKTALKEYNIKANFIAAQQKLVGISK